MTLRIVATGLWFLTGWAGAAIVVGIFGLPTSLAILGGIGAGAVVFFDPSGKLFGRRTTKRRTRPINEVAAELESQAAGSTAVASDRFPG